MAGTKQHTVQVSLLVLGMLILKLDVVRCTDLEMAENDRAIDQQDAGLNSKAQYFLAFLKGTWGWAYTGGFPTRVHSDFISYFKCFHAQ